MDEMIQSVKHAASGEESVESSREKLGELARYAASNLNGDLLKRYLSVVESVASVLEYLEEGA